MPDNALRYAGFWPRLGALLLDMLICLPWGGLMLYGEAQSRLFLLYFLVPNLAYLVFYNIYLVRRFGGTPGKLLAGIQIRKLDMGAIGYREAALRSSPDLLFLLLGLAALAFGASTITDSQYFSYSLLERREQLENFAPAWYRWANIAEQVWLWSELVVLLTNRKRRALHDFLAGTVVVVRKTLSAPPAPATADSIPG